MTDTPNRTPEPNAANDDVLARLRSRRQRPTVPPRTDPLLDKGIGRSDAPPPADPGAPSPSARSVASATDFDLAALRADIDRLPPTRRHSAIVLDAAIDRDLTRYCKDRGITVELWLEAAWTLVGDRPDLQEAIAAAARQRYEARKHAGKLRRLYTMLAGEKARRP